MQPYAALSLLHSRPGSDLAAEQPARAKRRRVLRSKRV